MCHPLNKQITNGLAKGLCLICFVAAVVLSSPAPVLYGGEIVPTSNPNITGVRCGEENRFHNKPYMTFLNTGYISICLIVFIVLVVLYSAMWRVIRTHIALRKGTSVVTNILAQGDDSGAASTSTDSTHSTPTRKQKHISPTEKRQDTSYRKRLGAAVINQRTRDKHKARTTRTNVMFLYITVIFFFSYMPHFTLKILAFAISDFTSALPVTSKVLYHIVVWSFFINNVANPLVYFIFDLNFRVTVKSFYRTLLCGTVFKYATDVSLPAHQLSYIQTRRQ